MNLKNSLPKIEKEFKYRKSYEISTIDSTMFCCEYARLKQTNQIKLILSSPDLAFNDIRWLVGMLNLKAHYVRNKKLLDYTLSANIYDVANEYSVPMYFYFGRI